MSIFDTESKKIDKKLAQQAYFATSVPDGLGIGVE